MSFRLASATAINLCFAAGFLILVFVGVALARTTDEAHEATQWVRHTEEVLLAIGDARESFARVDAAQRGYLLTGLNTYLQERDGWIRRLNGNVASLQVLTRDNGAQHELVTALEALVRQRIGAALDNGRSMRSGSAR